jgi:hypothetical protein
LVSLVVETSISTLNFKGLPSGMIDENLMLHEDNDRSGELGEFVRGIS